MTISFDELPYQGRAIHTGRPESIAVEGWLRGIRVRHPSRARILELGCAEGANLMALAYHLPEARFVGVDASARQIELAERGKAELGLENVSFHHAGIERMPDAVGGDFDYILCHGVLSWVDAPVREAILASLAQRLAPRGIGYLSYNVAAGWAMRGLIRNALRARTRGVEGAGEKLREARELLKFMSETPFSDHPYGGYLAAEARDTLTHRDPYVAHEYLTEHNVAFTYGEIAALAGRHGLRFLAELSPIAHRGIEEQTREIIAGITEDAVEREELSDVLFGRAFRASLFVREDVETIDPHEGRRLLLDAARFVTTLQPVSQHPSVQPNEAESFADREGIHVSASHPILKAALLELSRAFPRGVSFAELADRALGVLHLRRVRKLDEGFTDEERTSLEDDLVRLVSLRHLDLRLTEPAFAPKAGERPRLTTLTRHEARRDEWITSGFHEAVFVDAAARFLIELCDGSRDRDQLAEQLYATLQAHDVEIRDEAGTPLGGDAARRAMRIFVDRHIATFEQQGLIER
jgi:SAM-dependent methyltransferase